MSARLPTSDEELGAWMHHRHHCDDRDCEHPIHAHDGGIYGSSCPYCGMAGKPTAPPLVVRADEVSPDDVIIAGPRMVPPMRGRVTAVITRYDGLTEFITGDEHEGIGYLVNPGAIVTIEARP